MGRILGHQCSSSRRGQALEEEGPCVWEKNGKYGEEPWDIEKVVSIAKELTWWTPRLPHYGYGYGILVQEQSSTYKIGRECHSNGSWHEDRTTQIML